MSKDINHDELPSELLKEKDNTPLTEEQKKIIDEYDKKINVLDDLDKKELPKLNTEQMDNLKKLLSSITNNKDNLTDRIDYEYYNNNKKFFNEFLDFTINNSIGDMDISKFIKKLTNFNYNPFNGIDSNMILSMQDRLIYLYELGKLFNENFIENININYSITDITVKMMNFIKKNKIEISNFERNLWYSLFGKLILSMFSSTERVFIQDKPCLTDDYLDIIQGINKEMQNLCESSVIVNKSWSIFYHKLTDKKTYYKYTDYNELSNRLKECYDNKFPIEILLADCLKQLIPSISLDYLYVIKNIYLLGRFITIYCNTRKEITMKDLIVICRAISVEYESYYFSIAMIPRSMPTFIENCSEEFKLYYISHALTGPQYYLLKQLSYSVPCFLTKIN